MDFKKVKTENTAVTRQKTSFIKAPATFMKL